MSTLIKCPHCGQATVAKTAKGAVKNAAAHFGGGVVEGTVQALADGFLFDGAGKLVPEFGSRLANLVSLEYICNSCDCIFQASVNSDGELNKVAIKKLPMPEEIIEREREKYIQVLRKKRPYMSTVVFGLLTLYCIIFMFVGIINEEPLKTVLAMFMAIPFLIPTILKWKKVSSLNQQISDCESQPSKEFKHSHRELFSQYSQYN